MAEYIELGAAIALIREQGIYGEGHSDEERENDVISMLESIPAADVVEVVRCKKCRFGRNPLPDHGTRQCAKTLMFHPADWYCPNGDRMVSKDVSHLSPEAQGLYHALMNRMDGED